MSGVRTTTGRGQGTRDRVQTEQEQQHEQEHEEERRRSSVVEVVVGEVGPVTIIARTLGVEVGLGHNLVVGLAQPAVTLPGVIVPGVEKVKLLVKLLRASRA